MAQVENVDKVIAVLKRKAEEAKNVSVVVGYTQSYAVHVHENLEAFHEVGQAKYLEQPARTLKNVLAKIVVDAVKKGAGLAKALLMAGLRLQRESQKLCPVDTGALKNSAFTRLEQ